MTGAMYAAVSGLKAHMNALNVIGNNISNVNTLAYKATRYTFNESLYTSSRSGSNGTDQVGGRNPAQIGYGCSIGTIDLDMSTKNYTPTGRPLDTMIDGDGFFMVGDKTKLGVRTQDMLQGMRLTRLGNFEFDSQGWLVDGNGNVVYGFLRMTTPDTVYKAQLTDGVATDEDLTYPSEDDVPENALTSPILTGFRYPNCVLYTNPTTGNAETIIVWPRLVDGQVVDIESLDDLQTALADPAYLAQYSADDLAVLQGTTEGEEQPKLEFGRLQPDTVSIDEKSGAITIVTKDEKQFVIGYLALAKVDNPNGVTHVDGRYYQAMGGAGNVHLTSVGGAIQFVPGAGGEGDEEGIVWTYGVDENGNPFSNLTVESSGGTNLVTGGLESSGTDLATEISNMVVIQRGYQANTRIVSVTDSMLEELVNMKR